MVRIRTMVRILDPILCSAFYNWNLQPLIDSLYSNCYFSSVIQKQPLVVAFYESKTEVNHLHRYFYVDIIRRNGQYIMLLVDHFSNLAQAILTNSEKADNLNKTHHPIYSSYTPKSHHQTSTMSTAVPASWRV